MNHPVTRMLFCSFGALALSPALQAQSLWRTYSMPGWYGEDVSMMEDVDADGHMDFAVLYNPPGGVGSNYRVDIVSGVDGSLIGSIPSVSASTSGAQHFDTIGDVDGDGVREVILSNPNQGLLDNGATVYSGRTQNVLYQLLAAPLEWSFGSAVSEAGDINGDGTPDFLVGIDRDRTNGFYSGALSAYSGLDCSRIWKKLGNPGEYLGWWVGPAGDVNGDGYHDFCGGARSNWASGSYMPGYVRVYSGFDGSVLHEVQGADPSESGAWHFTDPGDLDGDGIDDFVITSPHKDGPLLECGMLTAYSGADGNILYRVFGDQVRRQLGKEVDTLGDANGDGVVDLVVSATGGSDGPNQYGAIYVLSGVDGSQISRTIGPDSAQGPHSRGVSGGTRPGRGTSTAMA